MKAIIRGLQSMSGGIEVMFDVFDSNGIMIDTIYVPIYVVSDLNTTKTGGDITQIAISRFLADVQTRKWQISVDDIYAMGMNTVTIKEADTLTQASKVSSSKV